MAFKPNYRQQRGERARNKDKKKQEKLQRREEQSAKRKAPDEGQSSLAVSPNGADDPPGIVDTGDTSD